MFKWISNLFKSLNANTNPAEIAHALSLGVLSAYAEDERALVYDFRFLLFRANQQGHLRARAFGRELFRMDARPTFASVGYSVLTYAPFENVFARLIDIPFVGFTKFNNTVVMGSLVVGLAAYIPFFLIGFFFVKFWRKHVAPTFVKSPLHKAVQKLPLLGKLFEAAEDKFLK